MSRDDILSSFEFGVQDGFSDLSLEFKTAKQSSR